MTEPGWYADPLGPPGSYRWWDGTSWTDQVTSAPPATVPAPAPPAPPAPAPAWGTPPGRPGDPGGPPPPDYPGYAGGLPPAPPTPPSRNRTPLLIAAVAAVVLLAALAAFFLTRDGDDDVVADDGTEDTADDETTTTEEEDETTTTEEGDDGGDDGDVISNGTISFAALGGDWTFDQPTFPELPRAAGQFQIVQDEVPPPIDGPWFANVTIGDLDPTIPYSGPESLEAATQALSDKIIQSGAYPAGTTSQVVLSEAQEVDGNEAFVVRSELQYAVPGLEATGETVLIAVIDTDQGPAAFWGSIPNSASDLVADMDEAFESLTVDD
ncbi:MAG: DUF2510 domain-containing protein [Acidimicrobiales bacterium]